MLFVKFSVLSYRCRGKTRNNFYDVNRFTMDLTQAQKTMIWWLVVAREGQF